MYVQDYIFILNKPTNQPNNGGDQNHAKFCNWTLLQKSVTGNMVAEQK